MSSNAKNSAILKRSQSGSFKKVNVLNLLRKKLYAEVAKIYGNNESSIHVIVKKKKKSSSFARIEPQTEKVTATACEKCLVR